MIRSCVAALPQIVDGGSTALRAYDEVPSSRWCVMAAQRPSLVPRTHAYNAKLRRQAFGLTLPATSFTVFSARPLFMSMNGVFQLVLSG